MQYNVQVLCIFTAIATRLHIALCCRFLEWILRLSNYHIRVRSLRGSLKWNEASKLNKTFSDATGNEKKLYSTYQNRQLRIRTVIEELFFLQPINTQLVMRRKNTRFNHTTYSYAPGHEELLSSTNHHTATHQDMKNSFQPITPLTERRKSFPFWKKRVYVPLQSVHVHPMVGGAVRRSCALIWQIPFWCNEMIYLGCDCI